MAKSKRPPPSPKIAPPTGNYRQIPALAFSDWTNVLLVKQALNSHEWGIFKDSALLVDAMGRDDRIQGVTETRINALNGLPLEWIPADDSQKALDVAADVKRLFHKMVPEPLGNKHRRWGLDLGIGLSELLWEDYGSNSWVPTIRVWHPQYLYWRWDTWSYWLNTADSSALELFAGERGLYKWFMYLPYGPEMGWMDAAVRSLSIPWMIRQWGMRDWARYSEVHGTPIRAGIVPSEGGNEDHKERFIRELSSLGNETVIRLEQAAKDGPKFDLKLVEAQANTWEGFEKLITLANVAIAVRRLGQNLTTEIGGQGASGSKAAANVHDRVRSDFLRSDGSTYAQAFKEQVLEPFCLFNYGTRNLAPKPLWKTDAPEDKSARATTLNQLGQALQGLMLAGMPIDVIQVAKEFAIPLVGEEQSSKPQADHDQVTTAPVGEDKNRKTSDAARVALQAARRTRVKPHVEGQSFVDEVSDIGLEKAKTALRPDLAKLNAIIQALPEQNWVVVLRRKLIEEFGAMKPGTLARLMDKCLILADHAGRHSVLEEL